MKTAIITIGDEILIGQIVDTNSAWMAKQLTFAGFEVTETRSIGDNAEQIKNTLDDVFNLADVVLLTGGLGPTKDDITKKTLCTYFNTQPVFDETVLATVQDVISNFTSLNELTRNQAYVPENATIIQNKVGTAPVMWFDYREKVLVSMPGVPYEMQYAMEKEIIPRLQAKFISEAYLKHIFLVYGYTESALAMHLADFEEQLPEGFALAYLPSAGIVKLRLFAWGEKHRAEMEIQAQKLRNILGESIASEEDIPSEAIIGKRLTELNLTIGTAESCTGGNIARQLINIPGASHYFKGSIIAYANEVKTTQLHVLQTSLEQFGAVSETIAIEMAKGAQQTLKVDCVIAVTGIAGPDGGTPEKPVGTVWICTIHKDKYVAKKYQLGIYRDSNIMRATNLGILQLLKML